MKKLRVLWWLIAGSVVFAAGLFATVDQSFIKYSLLAAGAVIVSVFYIKTITTLLRSETMGRQRKMFWLIVIVCVPIMGNLAFVIIQSTLSTRQIPKVIG